MKGILMKPDMIQAVVDLRKTQTRRVITPQPEDYRDGYPDGYDCPPQCMVKYKGKWIDDGDFAVEYAPYKVGETVYIKEAYSTCGVPPDEVAFYKDELDLDIKRIAWRTPLFMPEWAARYFITILAVRAERLQEITQDDAEKEGFALAGLEAGCRICNTPNRSYYGGRCHFADYWNSLNPKSPWESNPWVFPYEFELLDTESVGKHGKDS